MEHLPVPAATLIVMREGPGAPELLVIERGSSLRFAAGATVFPGGRIEVEDLALASGSPDAAARIGAIRETLEETRLAIGLDPRPPDDSIASLRDALFVRTSFASALATRGIGLSTEVLVPFARWCPRHTQKRPFDTHFFLARAPAGQSAPSLDNGEVARIFWASAAELIASADAGHTKLIYPTRRNLERLAQFDSFDKAAEAASARPTETIAPWIEERAGTPHLCIPEGLGYPITAERLDRAVLA
ncbi:NUDIX hydrolase [Sphingomonas paucimobilis]|nr:NUDIX hydrolase [Sphingomonas paucimobilis]